MRSPSRPTISAKGSRLSSVVHPAERSAGTVKKQSRSVSETTTEAQTLPSVER